MTTSQTPSSPHEEPPDESVGELNLPLPVNHSPLPKFANLHLFFTKLASVRGEGSIERRNDIIAKFIGAWRKTVGDDMYPFVRLWFPEEDEQLKQLRRIKDTMVAKLIVQALDLPEKSPDAIEIMDVRRGLSGLKRASDESLSAKAKHAIEQRYAQNAYGELNIQEVTDKLIAFVGAKREERVTILKEFIVSMKASEVYWIIKIILGNLSLSCSVRTFLSVLHPDAVKVYLVNKNLKMVCDQLWSHEFQVTERDKCVHLLSHFFPMRAKFVKGAAEHMKSVADLMELNSAKRRGGAESGFFIEEKVDGERIQLHWTKENDTVLVFSRNGKDHTAAYQGIFGGLSVETPQQYEGTSNSSSEIPKGSFLDIIKSSGVHPADLSKGPKFSLREILADGIRNCILDGEVVAWDPVTNDICGQSKIRELAAHRRAGGYRHLFLVFDVVYANDRVLTGESLKSRKEQLEQILPPSKRDAGKGRIQILPYKVGRSEHDIAREFERIVSALSEGLVVKNMDSQYEVDGRSNSWIKVKPEFVDGYQGENLDLTVVGCYWGSGKHKNRFASYLCALRDETASNRFVALSRVGSGICVAMYDYINEKIDAQRFATSDVPEWLDLGTERKPDFYIHPNLSLIFEVKYSMILAIAAEKLGTRAKYGVGYSLRFPRYVSLREDKDWRGAATVGELMELYFSRPRDSQTASTRSSTEAGHRSRGGPTKKLRIKNDSPVEKIRPVTEIFKGLTFYVCADIQDPEEKTKGQLEDIIVMNGGSVTTNAGSTDSWPIADRRVPNAAKYLSQQTAVIHPRYVFDSVANGRALELEPSHFLGAAPETAREKELIDKFGFSLYRRQTRKDVESIFEALDVPQRAREERARALQELLNRRDRAPCLRGLLFAGMVVYDACPVAQQSDRRKLTRNVLVYGSAFFTSCVAEATHLLRIECTRPTRQPEDLDQSDPTRARGAIGQDPEPTLDAGPSVARPEEISEAWVMHCWAELRRWPVH